nr:immunoglobulin kappa light chain-like [Vulpes vulpes]
MTKNITFQCHLEKSTAAPQQEEKQRKGKQLLPVEMHFQIQDAPSTLWGGGHAETRLEQPAVVVAREKSSASLLCTANVKASYIHWYRYQEGKGLQRRLHLAMFQSDVQWDSVLEADKVTAIEVKDGYSCTLLVLKLEKSDEGMYYCASWKTVSGYGWNSNKVMGPGTQLRVTNRNLNVGTSPKPTIFLPSIAETTLQNAGTYLCLLENFFPDVIKIDWKEKNGKTVLKSQQGDTIKTYDTYMKFSWLTVTGVSVNKEYKCIIKHERNKGGVEQEILFPSQKKGIVTQINLIGADTGYISTVWADGCALVSL